jgi:4-amino-4-deoxy-L-arabinose transferase-like glycosyltransferase
MAEIDVVKKRSRTWIWVLLLVTLALVLWFVMGSARDESTGVYLQHGQPLVAAAHVTGTAASDAVVGVRKAGPPSRAALIAGAES